MHHDVYLIILNQNSPPLENTHSVLVLCLGLVFSVSLLVLLANRLKIAYPIFLTLAGLLISFIPAVPIIHIDSDLVFLVILPPILYDAAQNMSLKALWRWRRIISGMSIGFVLFTAIAVAFVSHWLIPGFTMEQGFLLGAIISPPDAAAATAILQYVKLPKGMVSILEGESLLNDATSLTIFRFALAAILTNHFTWGAAAGGFILVVMSGIFIGLLFGLIFYAIYKWLPTTVDLDIAISLVIPYIIYITAEAVHSSGVLAVVSGGLFIAYQNHFVFSHSSRLRSGALWSSIVFILNAVVFFLIGLQLPDIAKGIGSVDMGTALVIALVISLVVIVARMVAGIFTGVFTRFMGRYITVAQSNPGWRNPLIVGWVGMRGVVSLASALSIPLLLENGKAFPHRNLILFITFVTIVVTLVGQGLVLPWVIRIVKPDKGIDQRPDDQQIVEIELKLMNTAVAEMDEKYADQMQSNPLLLHKYEFVKNKIDLLECSVKGDGEREWANKLVKEYRRIMTAVTEKERSKLHYFRKKEGFDDDVIRLIENRLDLEEENMKDNIE
ncbi:Na+/H+ antiporter [Mucilaginibacter achroorhodeus]|uniref:Na+/H+ antiporter n=1 Tax=Mucilaginibacter achroorhodeus TaxID=2599294 RepID=A0A563TZ94_9SPHI|nr:Na+/H+ antiporter [Mucilaginibacter achroorhodeus]